LPSDDLFGQVPDSGSHWEGLERRINRLLEGIVQLRNANAHLMKENVRLKNQLRDRPPETEASPEENQVLRRQYEAALDDLKQVKQNLQRIETLADEPKLEEH
jgi:regulator of replication initiation timing